MNNVELLKMREKTNYDLCKSIIIISKETLNEKSINYGIILKSINDELYYQITVNIFTLLEDYGVVIRGTQQSLYDNADSLRNMLQKELSEFMQISGSLSKIMDEKLGQKLLEQIKDNGSKIAMNLDEYVYKTVRAGKTLSSSSFPNIENLIEVHYKKIIADLRIQSTSEVAGRIEERLDNYKSAYLYKLGRETKLMFGSFADFVSTTGTYFGNYSESVDEVLAFNSLNVGTDELGVPKERKSLTENLESIKELYMPNTNKTK